MRPAVFYVFLVVVGLVGVALYVTLFVREVPGFAEQRFGKLEDLPADTGKWRQDPDSPEGKAAAAEGLRREVRHWFDSDKNKLSFQVRYRDAETNEIVKVEPDVAVKRKRIKV
jgi:hypothetical protein